MTFDVVEDMELFRQIANWDGMRKVTFSVDKAKTWTEGELRTALPSKSADVDRFLKNINLCDKDSKERNAQDKALIMKLMSSNAVVYKSSLFVFDKRVNHYISGTKALDKLVYDAFKTTKITNEVIDYLTLDDDSDAVLVTSLRTRFIAVGNRFFDTEKGEMVDEAPKEFRTFSIKHVPNYRRMNLKDCKTNVMTDLCKYIGFDNLDYLLHAVAYNLIDLRSNKKALLLLGRSRSGKGTIIKLLVMIGLAPEGDYGADFDINSRFTDNVGSVMGVYPVLPLNEVESLNWTKTKKIVSEDEMQIEAKGDKKQNAVCRALPIITTNKSPYTSILGIDNKFVALKTQETFKNNVDDDYLRDISTDVLDELVNVILSYTLEDWRFSDIPESVQEFDDVFHDNNAYHDRFLTKWIDDDSFTSRDDAYKAYLMFANPDLKKADVDYICIDTRKDYTSVPKGLVGLSRRNFYADMRVNHKEIKKNGVKGFAGRPCIILEPLTEKENNFTTYF